MQRLIFFLIWIFLASTACTKDHKEISVSPQEAKPIKRELANHVEVQHLLIAFGKTLSGKKVSRTQAQAKKLAEKLYAKAKKNPTQFGRLVRSYSDDQFPGIYDLANFGVAQKKGEFKRGQMVSAFGDAAFQLKKGELGLVNYDPKSSPYGYHIIKRIR